MLPGKAPRENPPFPLPASSGCRRPVTCGSTTLTSASSSHGLLICIFSFVCILAAYYKDTSYKGPSRQSTVILSPSLNYIHKDSCFQLRTHSQVPGRHIFWGPPFNYNYLPFCARNTIAFVLFFFLGSH